jgi:oligopeptide transport system substrate-binding protein
MRTAFTSDRASFLSRLLFGLLLLTIPTLSTLTLTSCKPTQTLVETASQNGILLLGTDSELTSLDPQLCHTPIDQYIHLALFEGLLNYNPQTLAHTPATASTFEISPDHLTYTFYIRPEAKWSDGTLLTAQDFTFAYQRILSPDFPAPDAYKLYPIKNAEDFHSGKLTDFSQVGIRAVSDHILQITLERPLSFFPNLVCDLAYYPVPKHITFSSNSISNLVYNGPFTLKNWQHNKILETTKNPHYWNRSQVTLNGINFYAFSSASTEELAFRAGQLHITYSVPASRVDRYIAENNPNLRIAPHFSNYCYYLNTARPPLNNPTVRQALALALDRQSLIGTIIKRDQQPAYTFTPHVPDYNVAYHMTENVELARELLAKAGFPDGENFPALELLFNNSDVNRPIAEAIQQRFKKVLNIDIVLVNQEWKVFLHNLHNHNFDIARYSIMGDYYDPSAFVDTLTSNSPHNYAQWKSAEYDRLIEQAQNTLNQQQRFDLMAQAESLMLQQAPALPIYFRNTGYLIHPNVENWFSNYLNLHPYTFVKLKTQLTEKVTH